MGSRYQEPLSFTLDGSEAQSRLHGSADFMWPDQTARQFTVEASKRQILGCEDLAELKKICLVLIDGHEALREMLAREMLRGL
jgi:hypothetical protein